ncbi:MAG: amidohydrolase [Deltaproteobacteria bacterium]|nr:amidohydrolase [Candidatus Zymogenaceae bacterium]
MTEKVDLIVKGGPLLTFDEEDRRFTRGIVCIKDGKIAAVGDEFEIGSDYEADRTIDTEGDLIMPGLINGHTHAAMSLLRGYADDLPLSTWLFEHIIPAETKLMGGQMVYWGTLVSVAEMLRAGITTCADAYFFASAAARAFKDSGMRAVAAQGVMDGPKPQWADDDARKEVLRSFFAEHPSRPGALVTPALFVHAPYTACPETYRQAKAMCDENGALLFTHLAESEDEAGEITKRYGTTPVRLLAREGILSDTFVGVHAVWVQPEEIEILAQYGASVVHCPNSNAKLGNGLAPVTAMLGAGIAVGLGTDGPASNNRQDLFYEMDFCAKGHKLVTRDPARMDARTVLKMALYLGAEALGLEETAGSLAPGMAADMIVLDLAGPHAAPLFSYESHLVYSARGGDVKTTIVGGRVVYHDREILSFDEAGALARASEIIKKL